MINDSSDIKTDIQNFVGFIKQQTDQLISLALSCNLMILVECFCY